MYLRIPISTSIPTSAGLSSIEDSGIFLGRISSEVVARGLICVQRTLGKPAAKVGLMGPMAKVLTKEASTKPRAVGGPVYSS